MRNLATLKARIDRLLEARGEENEPPAVLILLPACGREPVADTRPWPRMNRVGRAAVITYQPADGKPDAEAIAVLLAGKVPS